VSTLDGKKQEGCIFCQFPAEDRDAENWIIHRGQHSYVILNAFPYASGHVLVLPYRHVADITELDDEELLEINQLVARSVAAIRAVYNPDGFNLGVNLGSAGGAGIPGHIHWHVVPRWSADTNFVTTVGGIRIIPEDLSVARDKILSQFAEKT